MTAQAAVAQVVAHLIGSEEVTGPSPVSSLIEKIPEIQQNQGFPVFLRSEIFSGCTIRQNVLLSFEEVQMYTIERVCKKKAEKENGRIRQWKKRIDIMWLQKRRFRKCF